MAQPTASTTLQTNCVFQNGDIPARKLYTTKVAPKTNIAERMISISSFFIDSGILVLLCSVLWRPCGYELAAGLGFEPRYWPPKGHVLPLDDPAMFTLSLSK